ncbi:hypothetical protein PTKIN_Ptkin14bG0129300 [Pterospermum kingtungense]
MERLTRLQTLKEFIVSSRGLRIEVLGKLSHLQGDLTIRGLGNVADIGGAMEAQLWAKTGLRKLGLQFDSNEEMRRIRKENEAFLVEVLQPPSNLETLDISWLSGPTLFPDWMMSLMMLRSVTLRGCANWESLPPMGKLPSLEHLVISDMDEVKKAGEAFLGTESEDLGQTSSSSSSVTGNNIAFPNLKSLEFYSLEKWEEWEYENISSSQGGQEDSSCMTIIMPRLQSLRIRYYRKLKALPHHLLHNTPTVLQELYIWECPILEERFEKGRGEDWPYIFHISNITIDGEIVRREVH